MFNDDSIKKDAILTKVVVKLQRSVEIVGQSIRLLMKDIIQPFWVRLGKSYQQNMKILDVSYV